MQAQTASTNGVTKSGDGSDATDICTFTYWASFPFPPTFSAWIAVHTILRGFCFKKREYNYETEKIESRGGKKRRKEGWGEGGNE